MTRLGTLLLAVTLAAGCRDAAVGRSDRAVEELVGQRGGNDPVARSAAEAEFAARRDAMIEQYRVQHRVFAMQTDVARSLIGDPTLSPEAAQKVNDLLLALQRELAEAEQAIDTLALIVAEQWDASYTTAQTAMMQLEGAHRDVWNALSVERTLVSPS